MNDIQGKAFLFMFHVFLRWLAVDQMRERKQKRDLFHIRYRSKSYRAAFYPLHSRLNAVSHESSNDTMSCTPKDTSAERRYIHTA